MSSTFPVIRHLITFSTVITFLNCHVATSDTLVNLAVFGRNRIRRGVVYMILPAQQDDVPIYLVSLFCTCLSSQCHLFTYKFYFKHVLLMNTAHSEDLNDFRKYLDYLTASKI